MKRTPLYESHRKLNAKMIEYAQYEMPVSYAGIQQEHLSVRTQMGVFDVSHMGEFLIEGPEALAFTNVLVSNVIPLDLAKVTYALLLNDEGFPLDDLLVYVLKEDQVLLVVNAGNRDKDYAWIEEKIKGYDATLTDVSEQYGQIAIQGPKVQEIIDQLLEHPVNQLTFMTYETINYQGAQLLVSRTGYTGEDGFEIYGPPEIIVKLWDLVIEMGAAPCGLGARDTLRFQANLPLYGQELSEAINPYESGLGFAVKLNKETFFGKEACRFHKENRTRKLIGFELLERNIPRHDYLVFKGEEQIGVVTTGYLLPDYECPIGVALIDKDAGNIGDEVEIAIRNRRVKAVLRDRKFYHRN